MADLPPPGTGTGFALEFLYRQPGGRRPTHSSSHLHCPLPSRSVSRFGRYWQIRILSAGAVAVRGLAATAGRRGRSRRSGRGPPTPRAPTATAGSVQGEALTVPFGAGHGGR